MIELFEKDQWDQGRRSSKGNQLKWRKNDLWIKADYTGYEGLAETMVSRLLQTSDLKPNEYVVYDPEVIRYGTRELHGVVSKSFLKSGWQMITLERLYQNYCGQSLSRMLWTMKEPKERLLGLVSSVERITGIRGFGIYLSKVITIDALFLNEDRHMHNLAVLMNPKGKYELCPIFDQGACLMADTTLDYPLGEDPLKMISRVKPKTFANSFDEQLDLCEEIYGTTIHFAFGANSVEQELQKIEGYSDEIKIRVLELILEQRRKYGYLFI